MLHLSEHSKRQVQSLTRRLLHGTGSLTFGLLLGLVLALRLLNN